MPSYLQVEALEAGLALAVAPFPLDDLARVLAQACAQLPIQQGYLLCVADTMQSQQQRLLLALRGSNTQTQRQLAALAAALLPEDLEMDLIELDDESLWRALHQRCEPFYSV